jgi:hypothetical protein
MIDWQPISVATDIEAECLVWVVTYYQGQPIYSEPHTGKQQKGKWVLTHDVLWQNAEITHWAPINPPLEAPQSS